MTSAAVREYRGPTERGSARGRRAREWRARGLAWFVLSLLAVMFILPLLWMVSTSLKSLDQVFSRDWVPNPMSWSNFPDALTSAPFDVYFCNTAIITVLSTVGAVLSSSLVAYAFARLRWPARDLWFGIVLATMMLPGPVTLVPRYILFSRLGWVDTFLPLIVPYYLGVHAFYIFLMRQFFRGIPLELSEAARIDGAGELRIWWQIVMPLAKPALATITIFAFNQVWQDYLDPLIYLSSESNYTLQIGLTIFKAGGGGLPLWHWMMAASLVAMSPVIVVFFLGQRYFIESLALTGIKA